MPAALVDLPVLVPVPVALPLPALLPVPPTPPVIPAPPVAWSHVATATTSTTGTALAAVATGPAGRGVAADTALPTLLRQRTLVAPTSPCRRVAADAPADPLPPQCRRQQPNWQNRRRHRSRPRHQQHPGTSVTTGSACTAAKPVLPVLAPPLLPHRRAAISPLVPPTPRTFTGSPRTRRYRLNRYRP